LSLVEDFLLLRRCAEAARAVTGNWEFGMSSLLGSVTFWIRKLKGGESEAMQKLWEGYFARLVSLARTKLRGAPRHVADEEDVALSVFDSFFRAVEKRRFPRLDDRGDLWQILVLLAERKAVNLAKHQLAAKRGHGRVRSLSPGPADDDSSAVFAEMISHEPDPRLAVEVAEHCERLLGLLDDDQHRQIALWKLENYTNEEIATKINRTVPTVERKLKRIRSRWEKELPTE
jgi:DNA-directed RNA polymerase specialized sigma24 family protein